MLVTEKNNMETFVIAGYDFAAQEIFASESGKKNKQTRRFLSINFENKIFDIVENIDDATEINNEDEAHMYLDWFNQSHNDLADCGYEVYNLNYKF